MKIKHLLVILILLISLSIHGCSSDARVGELRTESQAVELGDAKSVSVKIKMGAGDLKVNGGTENLLEADFTYNVAKLKPEVKYAAGTLAVGQPDAEGFPDLRNIAGFRNEWDLRLYNDVPMNVSVNIGAGTSDLRLAGLSLTGLDITLGAGTSTIDLSGDWAHDLDITIDTGATNIIVLLPKDVGVRVQVEAGPHTIEASGLTQDGNIYTNAAYGASVVTLLINMQAGIGTISLKVEE